MSDEMNRIVETDEVGNTVATYVQSSSRSGVYTSRVDIIVSTEKHEANSPLFYLKANLCSSDHQIQRAACKNCWMCFSLPAIRTA